jgi:hypothetical protein
MTTLGALDSVTSGSFRESKPHWLLSGDESEEGTVPSVPKAAVRRKWKRPFAPTISMAKAAVQF